MTKSETVCILGLGYIGLPTAAMFATHGKKVIGVDVNEKIIKTLNSGNIHIQEPGLQELVDQAVKSGNLILTTEVQPADVFIIAVPTPFQKDINHNEEGIVIKKADMQFVISAVQAVLPHLKTGNLVILESTSPPRTTIDIVRPILEQNGLKAGEDFLLAYSPERVLPGQILKELIENARVIGGVDQASAQAGKALYTSFVKGDILFTDANTAEMVKLMENTYRDVNIALANEFSRLVDPIGFDVWDAIELANHHPRVNILQPGIGVGGHCISVDPWFLVEKSPDLTPLIRQAREVNDGQPEYVVKSIENAIEGSLEGKRIAVLGLAYKPDVDDFRESPAVEIVKLLASKNAEVVAYDPFLDQEKFETFKTETNITETVSNADLIIVMVRHKQFLELIPQKILGISQSKIIIDLVRCFNYEQWTAAGFKLFQLGN